MNACLSTSEILEIGQEALSQFDQALKGIPENLCGAFNQEAKNLETKLLMIHSFVVKYVKKEEDLDVVATMWKVMAEVCDLFISKISELKNGHPACGAEFYYDRILDLRNRCKRLQKMHE